MPGKLVYQAYRLFWSAIDWLYPPVCGGCGTRGERWCAECFFVTRKISPPVCPICGRPQADEQPCERCQASPPQFRALRSWAIFGDRLRQAIHRLKYKGDLALGDVLSRPMIDSLRQWKWQVDLVTPVPIGLARLAERGYNQAALLARPIAWGLGWPYHSDGLYRVRETRSQVGLSLDERQQNVKDAFRARSKYVAGKSVLVVDDVTTSGATLKACAAALLEAGADQVYGLTLARTAMEDPRDAHPA